MNWIKLKDEIPNNNSLVVFAKIAPNGYVLASWVSKVDKIGWAYNSQGYCTEVGKDMDATHWVEIPNYPTT